MCGIAGVFAPDLHRDELKGLAGLMSSSLHHRGPDSSGSWLEESVPLALSHSRLAIVDLSVSGSQPMVSAGGRWILTYNGEIYNHGELRRALEREGASPQWIGHSDTETILACVAAWGIDETLSRLDGMFAFGLWDRTKQTLHLIRDRCGEKPLYYGWQSGRFMFASELHTLALAARNPFVLDRSALEAMLERGCVPCPMTPYLGLFKLPPAAWISLGVEDFVRGTTADHRTYWRLPAAELAGEEKKNDVDWIDQVETTLLGAISRQLVADVPVGVFLSGGIDSTTVLALATECSPGRVKTFSIGMEDSGYDESAKARRVAAYFQSEHAELIIDTADALALVPKLGDIYDEPFGDASQIPTLLVSALARRSVKVSLSGDGGDEVFWGYNRHVHAALLRAVCTNIPLPFRNAAAKFLNSIPIGLPTRIGDMIGLPGVEEKWGKLSPLLQSGSVAEMHSRLLRAWSTGKAPVSTRPPGVYPARRGSFFSSAADSMAREDFATYLHEDILVKVDRAAMHHGLETRSPFLSRDVIELAFHLPPSMKVRNGGGKWVLRQVLARRIPPDITRSPKRGFALPLAKWLRTGLRDWVEEMLSERNLAATDLLDVKAVRYAWAEHLSGRVNRTYQLWHVLMLQCWLNSNRRSWRQ